MQYTKRDGSLYEKELSGGESNTTNNRMELRALAEGLKALKVPCKVTVVTDSQLLVGWLSLGWNRNNAELTAGLHEVEQLIRNAGHEVTYQHVRGHAGHPMNERCDVLAKAAKPLA